MTAAPGGGPILALGGGGFTGTDADGALDELVLALSPRREPRLCFLPTASGDADEQVRRFHETYADRPCVPTHLSLFRLGARPVDVRELLLAQDVIYVGGGSLENMLAIWRVHGLDAILREAHRRGIALAGLSAGAMCWFTAGVTTSSGHPAPARGLGLLPGSLSVHLSQEPARLPVFAEAVDAGSMPPGWAADDGVALELRAGALVRAVTQRPHARALSVTPGEVRELAVERIVAVGGGPVRVPPPDPAVSELRRLRAGPAGVR